MIKKNKLGDILYQKNTISSQDIVNAFNKIDRADFILEQFKLDAYDDYPLPIGSDQTISQPSTVGFMLELLGASSGDKILDVGSGSGWTTALLASIVGSKGYVWGTEIIPELVEFGQKNLSKYKNLRAEIIQVTQLGLPERRFFDRILVSASAIKLPDELVDQLKIGGTMVLPISDSIWKIQKVDRNRIISEEYPGFLFVPLK